MKLRPLILIVLIVALPLAALSWAAVQIAENEQLVVQKRYRELMEERLQDINANVSVVFDDIERRFSQLAAIDDFDPSKLRQINRSEPHLLQLFVLNSQGRLTYPDPAGELNAGERTFLIQATQMFTGQDFENAVATAEQPPDGGNLPATNRIPIMQREVVRDVYQSQVANVFVELEETSGWFVWYWDRGLNLVYWQRRPSGHIVGCALERARWMADLIAQLPETVDNGGHSESTRSAPTRVRLLNSSAASVYQWGGYEPEDDERPLCEIPLTTPLASWRLQCFVPVEQITAGTGRTAYFGLIAGLSGVAAAFLVIAFFFVREYSRDMHEASQQVSFVNQVSHELKTPLTNIRMYAELLERDLNHVEAGIAEKPRERLGVILSEGQRLSRLIGNVLTFARQKRKTLQPQRQEEIPAQLIQRIVDRFRPALAEQEIDVQLHSTANDVLMIDADFLEQILGNLISNVEKYAANGRLLKIQSQIENGVLTVDVHDAGNGIAATDRIRVFQPFARVSNDLSYAAGTGIGLPIARELARLHGGDVVLMDGNQGCWFRATLKGIC
ncbi:MAG: HAMP domain-containing sensor histidine kinase [Planctomycetaceae bacterium]